MLNNEQLNSFERDGYVSGGPLLEADQVEQMRAELDRVVAQHDKGSGEQNYIGDTAAFVQRRDCFLQVTNLRELSDPFGKLSTSRRLTSDVERLLGSRGVGIFADSMLFKTGQNAGMNDWHQDGPSLDILRDPKLITAWIALDDVGPEDGPVCFARGSHRWSESPEDARRRLAAMLSADGTTVDSNLQKCLARRGEAHFHHGLTWHCSLPNRSGRPRRGYAIFYFPAGARFAANGDHYLKQFVESGDGEPLMGRHFPVLAG